MVIAMATVNINLTCDLQKTVEVQNLCKGNLFTQDAGANKINVSVYDGGEPVTLSGTVSAKVILPNGDTVTVTGGTISGNVVSITLSSNVYTLPGSISVFIKVTSSGVVTTIAAFTANVYRSTI